MIECIGLWLTNWFFPLTPKFIQFSIALYSNCIELPRRFSLKLYHPHSMIIIP